MEKLNSVRQYSMRTAYFITLVAVLAAIVMAALPQPALAAELKPPSVPAGLEVPAGNVPFLVGHAVGTQNYICLPTPTGLAFVLYTPQATLFEKKTQLTTHFFSPNPGEGGTFRPTWQHSTDTSTVWGFVADPTKHSSADPAYVAPDAIPWLLITKAGVQPGPGGGKTLWVTTFIQRVNTVGGKAPSAGCDSGTIGAKAIVPYEADYFFYRAAD